MTTYKGIEIDRMGRYYTVFFEGDEIAFDTIEEAHEFIDSLG